mgnify:CR=1 FL=1
MNVLTNLKRRFMGERDGASLVETGLLVGLIAVVAIVAVSQLGSKVNGVFTTTKTTIDENMASQWTAACLDLVSLYPLVNVSAYAKLGDTYPVTFEDTNTLNMVTVNVEIGSENLVYDSLGAPVFRCVQWSNE